MSERIVHFNTEAPLGWHKVATTKHLATPANKYEELVTAQHARWIENVGKPPEASRFVLVIPIHNEQVALPSFLSSLMLSDIPAKTQATIVFVSNRCTDGSEKIIDTFLENQIGSSQPTELEDSIFSDKGITRVSDTYTLCGLNFLHIVTTTGGKANALDIGNELVLHQNDDLLISIDANVYVEPDSISIMYGQAYRTICEEQSAVLLSTKSREDIHSSAFSRLALASTRRIRGTGRTTKPGVNGWMMAIDSRWIGDRRHIITNDIGQARKGGVPHVTIEDYALGVLARSENKSIRKVDTTLWGYQANNPLDRIRIYARYARGLRQLIRDYPLLSSMVREEEFLAKDFFSQMRDLAVWIKNKPQNTPFLIAKWIMMEVGYWKGLWDYWQSPNDHSWSSIKSTKG